MYTILRQLLLQISSIFHIDAWKRGILFGIAFFALLAFHQYSVFAEDPPSIITYQGKLLENNISATTTKAMKFVLYDSAVGGTAVYTAAGVLPTTSTVNITPTSGIFSIDLGDTGTNPIDPDIFNTSELYLEVTIDGTTLSPRKRLTSVPFAVNAARLGGNFATSTPTTTAYIPVAGVDGSFTFNTTTVSDLFALADATFFGTIFSQNISGFDGRFRVSEQDVLGVTTTFVRIGDATATGHAGALHIVGDVGNPLGTGLLISTQSNDPFTGVQASIGVSSASGQSFLQLGQFGTNGLIRLHDMDNLQTVRISGTSTIDSFIAGNVSLGFIGNYTPSHIAAAGQTFVPDGNDVFIGGSAYLVDDLFVRNFVYATEVSSTAFTLNGERITAWPVGGGDSLFVDGGGYLYPTTSTYPVVIGGNSTSTDGIFEVYGDSAILGSLAVVGTNSRLTIGKAPGFGSAPLEVLAPSSTNSAEVIAMFGVADGNSQLLQIGNAITTDGQFIPQIRGNSFINTALQFSAVTNNDNAGQIDPLMVFRTEFSDGNSLTARPNLFRFENGATTLLDITLGGTSTFYGDIISTGNLLVGATSYTDFRPIPGDLLFDGNDAYFEDLVAINDELFVRNQITVGTSSLRITGASSGSMLQSSVGTISLNPAGTNILTASSTGVSINTSTITSDQLFVDGDTTFWGDFFVDAGNPVQYPFFSVNTAEQIVGIGVIDTDIGGSGIQIEPSQGVLQVRAAVSTTAQHQVISSFGYEGNEYNEGSLFVRNAYATSTLGFIPEVYGQNSKQYATLSTGIRITGEKNQNFSPPLSPGVRKREVVEFNAITSGLFANAYQASLFGFYHNTDTNLLTIGLDHITSQIDVVALQNFEAGETLFVDSTNNRVGINSSSPQYDLTVSGTTYLGGPTIFDGNLIVGAATTTNFRPTINDMIFNGDDAYFEDIVGINNELFVKNRISLGTGGLNQLFFEVAGGQSTIQSIDGLPLNINAYGNNLNLVSDFSIEMNAEGGAGDIRFITGDAFFGGDSFNTGSAQGGTTGRITVRDSNNVANVLLSGTNNNDSYIIGNLSIGTTTPAQALLDVAGDIRVNRMSLGAGQRADDIDCETPAFPPLPYLDYGNILFGIDALTSNTTGCMNVAIGNHALYSNTTGFGNFAIGPLALHSNTTGYGNFGFGGMALGANTTGNANMAFGAASLAQNTSGFGNLGIGIETLFSNTTGAANIAIGIEALRSSTTGFGNVALGVQALQKNTIGSGNLAFGIGALDGNTVGNFNLGIGGESLFSNTTGSFNLAIGSGALFYNLGSYNLGIGIDALTPNADGQYNTGIGHSVLNSNLSGSYNTVLGYNSGGGITIGSFNTILGAQVGGLDEALSNNIIIADGEGNQRIRVFEDGYVSIGTTTPAQALLDVAGDIRVNGLTVGRGNNSALFSAALGEGALASNQAGAFGNTAVGYVALTSNLSGIANTAVGSGALANNTSGNINTAVGSGALGNNTEGAGNTSIGNLSLRTNTTGSFNTAIGDDAMRSSTEGNFNVGIGKWSLQSFTSGAFNTAIGVNSGGVFTSGTGNIFIGNNGHSSEMGTDFFDNGDYNTIIGGMTDLGGGSLSNRIILGNGRGDIGLNMDLTNPFSATATIFADTRIDGNLNIDLQAVGVISSLQGLCKSGEFKVDNLNQEIVNCNSTPSDLAELYETTPDVLPGHIVMTTGETITYTEQLFDPITRAPIRKDIITDSEGPVYTKDQAQKSTSIAILTRANITQSSQSIVGIVSTNPYQVLGSAIADVATNPRAIAITGRVPTFVNLENGNIAIGDAIALSSVAGVGMKARPGDATVGIALEPYTGGTRNKIMVAIMPGQFGLLQKIEVLEEQVQQVYGILSTDNPEGVTVGYNEAQGTVQYSGGALQLGGNSIFGVQSIVGFAGKWRISAEGVLVSTVETSQGSRDFYALQSEQSEIVLSGSATLESGRAVVSFDSIYEEIIDQTQPIKISVTLTSDANGIFVSDKTMTGFEVQELLGGTSNASFDWVAIAYRSNSATSNSTDNLQNELEEDMTDTLQDEFTEHIDETTADTATQDETHSDTSVEVDTDVPVGDVPSEDNVVMEESVPEDSPILSEKTAPEEAPNETHSDTFVEADTDVPVGDVPSEDNVVMEESVPEDSPTTSEATEPEEAPLSTPES